MKTRSKAIDGLRGIMIMLIVLLHSCKFGASWMSGTLANLFFFMVSGYLMFGYADKYCRKKVQVRVDSDGISYSSERRRRRPVNDEDDEFEADLLQDLEAINLEKLNATTQSMYHTDMNTGTLPVVDVTATTTTLPQLNLPQANSEQTAALIGNAAALIGSTAALLGNTGTIDSAAVNGAVNSEKTAELIGNAATLIGNTATLLSATSTIDTVAVNQALMHDNTAPINAGAGKHISRTEKYVESYETSSNTRSRNRYYDEDDTVDLPHYIYSRVKKIFPAYIASLIAIVLLDGVTSVSTIAINALMVNSGWFWDDMSINGPTWFLSTLLFVYIAFYVVCRFCRKENLPSAMLILAIAGYGAATFELQIPFLFSRTMMGLSAFCIGASLRYMVERDEGELIRRLSVTIVAEIAILAIIGCMIIGFDKVMDNYVFMYLVILCPALIILAVNDSIFSQVLSIPPLAYLGRISMYLFVWHLPFIHLFKKLPMYEGVETSKGLFIEAIYLLVVLGWCADWHAVETHIRKKIKRDLER